MVKEMNTQLSAETIRKTGLWQAFYVVITTQTGVTEHLRRVIGEEVAGMQHHTTRYAGEHFACVTLFLFLGGFCLSTLLLLGKHTQGQKG